jgi:hypothetical protein
VRIRDYVAHWNTDAKPFAGTATTDGDPRQGPLVQTGIKQLVDNNGT